MSPEGHIRHAENLAAVDPVKVTQADGFVVVSRSTKYDGAIPIRTPAYDYEHFDHLNDALDKYADYERGEYDYWRAVGIFPARNGMPCGEEISPLKLALQLRA